MKILSATLASVLLASSLVLASDSVTQVECQCIPQNEEGFHATPNAFGFPWQQPFTPEAWYHEAITAANSGNVRELERIVIEHTIPSHNPWKSGHSFKIPCFTLVSEDLGKVIHGILEHLVLHRPTDQDTPACILAIMEHIAPYSRGNYRPVGAATLAYKAALAGHRHLVLPLFGINKNKLHSDEFTSVLKDMCYDTTLTSRDPADWERHINGFLIHRNKIEKWTDLYFPDDTQPSLHGLENADSPLLLQHLQPVIRQEGRERLWKKRILYTLGACAIGALALYLRASLTAQTPMVDTPAGDGAAL